MKPEPFADPEYPKSGDENSDRELERVLGHAGQRAAQHQAEKQDQDACHRRPGARWNQHMTDRTDGDDDEDNLQPLEHDGLEGGRDRDGVPSDIARECFPAQSVGLLSEGFRLVVERDGAGRSQDRFAQPAHAEEQKQDPDHKLEHGDRDDAERRTKEGDKRRLPRKATSAASSSTPMLVPSMADRQPRTVPTASTIVSASINSTSDPRNAAVTDGPICVQSIIIQALH